MTEIIDATAGSQATVASKDKSLLQPYVSSKLAKWMQNKLRTLTSNKEKGDVVIYFLPHSIFYTTTSQDR